MSCLRSRQGELEEGDGGGAGGVATFLRDAAETRTGLVVLALCSILRWRLELSAALSLAVRLLIEADARLYMRVDYTYVRKEPLVSFCVTHIIGVFLRRINWVSMSRKKVVAVGDDCSLNQRG